jgi:hypothetical protein
MSIVTLRAAAPAGYPGALTETAVLTEHPEADFEHRWAAWQARGLAHDRVVRQRFIVMAIVMGAIALAAAILYGLLAV